MKSRAENDMWRFIHQSRHPPSRIERKRKKVFEKSAAIHLRILPTTARSTELPYFDLYGDAQIP